MERQEHRPVRRARRAPSRHTARLAGYAVLPAALLITGLFVSTSSYAVFNGRSPDAGNSWLGGTVILQHDASGSYSTGTTAFFSASGSSGLQPGGSVTRCIDIRSTGNLPSGEVRLYASVPTGTLGSRISLTVTQGTAGSTCAGFASASTLFSGRLDTFATASTGKDYATGYPTGWTPTLGANEVRAFRFTATLDSGVSSAVQGTSATLNTVWETQGT